MERIFYSKRRKLSEDQISPNDADVSESSNELSFDHPLHQRFEYIARKYSTEPAIQYIQSEAESEDVMITYGQLQDAAKHVSAELCSKYAPQSSIGILYHSSIEAIICILGIFSAGMIAVPMDPTFSDERKLRIIETTNMRCFFAPPTVESIRADIAVFAVDSRGNVAKMEGNSTCSTTEPSFVNAGDIAYVMCTSGTTGDPKIIWVPHKCAQANLVSFGLDYFQELGPGAVVAQVAPLTFDPSIIEIFLALNSGSRLAIFSKVVIADPLLLSRCLLRSKPTFLQCTPSVARRMGTAFSDVLSSESLQYMCFGGEIFPDVLELQKWTSTLSSGRISQLAFFNLYGVTEVSIWATVEEIPCELLRKAPPGTAISIGDPLCRTELLLVDAASQKPLFLINYSAEGTFETLNHERFGQMDLHALSQAAVANQTVLDPMELYIGGLNRECYLDEEKVCRRWIKSGDHVRRVENRLFFLGRRDGVVKRSGKRFHPEEVTAIIRKCPFVEDGLVWIDKASNDLNATVVLHQEDQQTAPFRRWIVSNVPDYMRPDRMITTGEAIPLNTNGKPDKVAFKMLSCSEFCRDLFLRFGHPDLDSKTHLVSLGATSIDIAQAARQFVNMFLLGDPEVIPRVQNIMLHTPSDEIIDSLSVLVTKPSQVEMKHGPIERVVGQLDADVVDLVYSASRKRYGNSVSPSSIETGQSEFRIKWRAFLGKCIDAAPLLASLSTEEDVCFIASHSGVISCIDVQSGVPVWTQVFDDRFEASCEYLDEMKAICVGGYSGRIYVLRASSGDLIHSAKLSPDPIKSAVVYDSSSRRTWLSCSNGTLFSLCISTNGIEQEASIGLDGPTFGAPLCLSSESLLFIGTQAGSLSCYSSAAPFKLMWKRKGLGPLFATPVRSGPVIVAPSATGSVYCFDVSGKQLWKSQTSGCPIFSSPCIVSRERNLETEILFAFGSHDGNVYFLSHDDGAPVSQCFVGGNLSASPCIYGGGIAAVSSSGQLAMVSPSGELLRTTSVGSPIFSHPVVSTKHNSILFGARDDNLYSFELVTATFHGSTAPER